jgi:hypothetical protein
MIAVSGTPSAERIVIASQQIGFVPMELVRRAVQRHLRSPVLGPRNILPTARCFALDLYHILETVGGAPHLGVGR